MHKIIAILLLVAFANSLNANDIQKLIKETQQMSQTPDRITMVWWVPTEFWRQTLKNNPRITDEQTNRLLKVVDDYSIFVVAVINVGPIGGMIPEDRISIEQDSELQIDGKIIPLLSDRDISPDTRNFVAMMKPILKNALGQFGDGMEFFIYSNRGDGKKLLDPTRKGQFSYTVFRKKFDWRLPLGSCLPPRINPKTGAEYPGDYIFDPYTGEKLVVKKDSTN